MTAPARALDLATRAGLALAAGERDMDADDAEAAVERASRAFVLLASACLAADPHSAVEYPPAAVAAAFGQAFGRGGRLYTAHFRWLLDAIALREAVEIGLPEAADPAAAETALERAELFKDAVDRFLERV